MFRKLLASDVSMTSYRTIELAISVFLVALGAMTLIGAYYTIEELEVLQDVVGARGFAYVIGAFVMIGGVVLVVMQTGRMRRSEAGGTSSSIDELGGDDPRFPASAWQAFAVFAALVIYALLMRPAGYVIATVLFIGSGVWIMGGRGLGRLLLFPLVYAIGTYLLFDTLLGVRIPDGILRPLIRAIGL